MYNVILYHVFSSMPRKALRQNFGPELLPIVMVSAKGNKEPGQEPMSSKISFEFALRCIQHWLDDTINGICCARTPLHPAWKWVPTITFRDLARRDRE